MNKKRKTESTEMINLTSTEGHPGEGTPVFVFNGIVPSNSLITILEEKIKPFIFHFLDSVGFR